MHATTWASLKCIALQRSRSSQKQQDTSSIVTTRGSYVELHCNLAYYTSSIPTNLRPVLDSSGTFFGFTSYRWRCRSSTLDPL